MRKALVVLVALVAASFGFSGVASAQDTVIGTVTADPAAVPAAGEYDLTATGSGFIPDTSILLGKCTSPAPTLVPGVSTLEEITAAAGAISTLVDCDVASAQNVEVDGEGNWSASVTAEVGDNFFLSAGALDGSQAGATWVPIVDAGAAGGEELPNTGVDTGLLAVIGGAVLGAGALMTREARRLR